MDVPQNYWKSGAIMKEQCYASLIGCNLLRDNPHPGDDRLRRERLVPECEPRGAELEKSAQKIKCQSHFLRRDAPRCLIRSRE
jgi:hypothetical protein